MDTANEQLTKISVIGHTNTGKTSLLRTLLRDGHFGEIKNASATTRHVSQVQIFVFDMSPLLTLYDTPGLEDATGVMEFLHEHTDIRADGVERLQAFLTAVHQNDPRLVADFSQEAKVIANLLGVDIAIYVIDAREPILSKYKDELAILASSGVPILPVFNFITNQSQNMQLWQKMLARRALHLSCAFDTVAFSFQAEVTLWGHIQSFITQTDKLADIKNLIGQRQQQWQELAEKGCLLIADFLINIASFQQKISENADEQEVLNFMQNAVRQAESTLQKQLMNLYRFYQNSVEHQPINIVKKEQDIFDTDLLAHYGIKTVNSSMAGMIVGAGIDVATLGTSLGLGTTLGAIVGGLLPNAHTIKDKAMGVKTISVDDGTILLLATRAQSLHNTLRHRGHADLSVICTSEVSLPWSIEKIPTPLKKAKARPHYCSLVDNQDGRYLRAELADKLSDHLEEHLTSVNQSIIVK